MKGNESQHILFLSYFTRFIIILKTRTFVITSFVKISNLTTIGGDGPYSHYHFRRAWKKPYPW